MGIADELKASFGDDFFDRVSAEGRHNWCELCVCGHLVQYHSASIGGSFKPPKSGTKMVRGEERPWTIGLDGCRGAFWSRNFETQTDHLDREANALTTVINPTCPCRSFQPVVSVDRPNRYFNQRVPPDRSDPARHPFVIGVKALHTHLAKRKPADPEQGGDPAWAEEEFDRRFLWLDGKRRCGLSKCTETDGVWPVYIDGERSELRCAAHR